MTHADKDDWTNLDKLTNLTHLDVSGSAWGDLHALGHLDFFAGWTALKIFKLSKCDLFKKHTIVRLEELQLLDVSWVKPHMKSQELHINTANASTPHILDYASEPLCVKSLVSLCVCGKFTSQLTDALQQLLHQCQHLTVLKLDGSRAPLQQARPIHIVVDDTHGARLTDLDLSFILCGFVNLDCSCIV